MRRLLLALALLPACTIDVGNDGDPATRDASMACVEALFCAQDACEALMDDDAAYMACLDVEGCADEIPADDVAAMHGAVVEGETEDRALHLCTLSNPGVE